MSSTDTTTTDADEPTDKQTSADDTESWFLARKFDNTIDAINARRERLSTSYDDLVAKIEAQRKATYNRVTTEADQHSLGELALGWTKFAGTAYLEAIARTLRWTYKSGRDGTVSLFRIVCGTVVMYGLAKPGVMAFNHVVRPVAQRVAQNVAKGAAKRIAAGASAVLRANWPLVLGALGIAFVLRWAYKHYSGDDEPFHETLGKSEDDEDDDDDDDDAVTVVSDDDDDEDESDAGTAAGADDISAIDPVPEYEVEIDYEVEDDDDYSVSYVLPAADHQDAQHMAKQKLANELQDDWYNSRITSISADYLGAPEEADEADITDDEPEDDDEIVADGGDDDE